MTLLDKYLDRVQCVDSLQEISQSFIELGPGGWGVWERISTDVKTSLKRCSRLATPVEKNLCKYRVKIAETRKKIAFLKGVNCRSSRETESCIQQMDDQIETMTNSLRSHGEKIRQLLIKARRGV